MRKRFKYARMRAYINDNGNLVIKFLDSCKVNKDDRIELDINIHIPRKLLPGEVCLIGAFDD